ncbi:PPP2R5D [Symbiodinium necroappetens]|uniref:PPP2R5D protein n=1 Tax=Symbiodinium necroappetens TaxID=1628268 RepID=A0A812SW10_9DINO|nr:PPP2R5D [Symbiodinium necroappetens]
MAELSAEERKTKILEDLKTLRQADLVEQSALELIVSEVTNKDPSWVDRPLEEWNGIKLDGVGRVQSIAFPENLNGKIQLHGLFFLENLKTFTLEDHSLSGFITFDHLPRGMEYLVCKGSASASTHGEITSRTIDYLPSPLRTLCLSRNGLTGNPLDESINWRRFYFLESIDLSHNKFDGSATLEKFMSPLEELNIEGNPYSGTLHLGVVLPNLRKLTVPELQFTADFDDVHTKKMQEIAVRPPTTTVMVKDKKTGQEVSIADYLSKYCQPKKEGCQCVLQ